MDTIPESAKRPTPMDGATFDLEEMRDAMERAKKGKNIVSYTFEDRTRIFLILQDLYDTLWTKKPS